MRCKECSTKVGAGSPSADFKAKLCGPCSQAAVEEESFPKPPKRKVATKRKAAKG